MEFEYNDEIIKRIIKTLSVERLEKYIKGPAEGTEDALKLYILNTTLCESFYTPLQGFEVAVRNALHERLTLGFTVAWYDDSNFMNMLQPDHRGTVTSAQKSIRDHKEQVTPGKMVTELNLGFWTGLLGPKYETVLWRRHFRHAFPHRPQGSERHEVHSAVNRIRRLRNRVAHHEPIMHRNLLEDHEIILRTVRWICPDTARWIEAQSRFPSVWTRI